MTKREFVSRLQGRLPLLHEYERAQLVDEMIAALSRALMSGRRVEIRGFGVFEVRHRSSRMAVNLRTGQRMIIAAKHVPFFRPGSTLLARLNRKQK